MDTVRGVRTLWTLLAGTHSLLHTVLLSLGPLKPLSRPLEGPWAPRVRARLQKHAPGVALRAALCRLAALSLEQNRGSETGVSCLWSPRGTAAVRWWGRVLTGTRRDAAACSVEHTSGGRV